MQILSPSNAAIDQALAVLRSGGCVIHPTETCYGIACDLTNPEAVAKLFAIKQRPADQPVSALFASVDEAKKYVEWNEMADDLAKKYLPGPLTIILRLKSDAPCKLLAMPANQKPETKNRKPTIGVRISSNPIAQMLVEKFGKPLSTTSANLHGKSEPYSVEEILEQFADQKIQPDLIIDGGTLAKAPPSTIVDCTSENPLVLRQGSVRVHQEIDNEE